MQYPTSGSPPLHHPVPQHPVNFQPSAQEYARNPYAPAAGAGAGASASNPYAPRAQPGAGAASAAPMGGAPIPPPATTAFNSLFNDPSAQIGLEVGRNALNYGQEYIGKNMEKYVSVGALRYYFQVSNSYVLRKVLLVLFPWRHKPWSRQAVRGDNGQETWALPRDDINAPDMYIPIMAFTTFLVLESVMQGLAGKFHPERMGMVASKSLALVLGELMFLKLTSYLLSASSSLMDLVAYSGYKFIGVALTTLAASISSTAKWTIFGYTGASTAFFMLRSLRYVLLPETSSSAATVNAGTRQRRIQFLFIYSFVCQFVCMWLLL